MLQVVGQVAARQLDGAAIGAGNHVEGAGGEVALRGRQKRNETRTYSTTNVGYTNTKGGGAGMRGDRWTGNRGRESDTRIPAAASSGRSSGSPPRCGCSGWAVPGSAAPALGLDRSKDEKHDEVSAAEDPQSL